MGPRANTYYASGGVPDGDANAVNTIGLAAGLFKPGQSSVLYNPVAPNSELQANYQAANAPAGGNTGGNTGGSTGGYVDPYAKYGGYTAYNNMVNSFNQQKTGILDSVNQRTNQDAQQYGYGVEDLFTSSKQAQDAINQKAAQNELAKIQGRGDILSKVSRGTRSAGVMLGQKNASNSSAAAAIANAYGDIGNRDLQKVEQGYQVNNEGIKSSQENFIQDRNTKVKRTQESKANIVNNIVIEAADKLQALDAQIAGASLPNRIALEQEKSRIRSEAQSKLSAYDSKLNEASGLSGYSDEQRLTRAQELAQLGTRADQPFQTSGEVNMQAQSQYDPSAGGLPLYSLPKRRI